MSGWKGKSAKNADSSDPVIRPSDASRGSSKSYPLYRNPLLKAEASLQEGRV